MKILVTGGSGFIGSHLTEALVKEGHEVTITSTGSEPKISGVKKVLYPSLEGIDWKEVYGLDAVFHQMANNDTRCQDESEMFRANVYGPIKLFVHASQGGCKKFIYASSTAVYGSEPAPYVEGVTQVKPLNVYGHSKAKFDEFAIQFAKDEQVQVTGFRYCNVYGPGEQNKGKRMSMIGQLARQMTKFKRPTLFAYGEQRRDWIYVKDVVKANLLALNRTVGEAGEIYNLGSGVASTFNQIVEVINDWMHANMGFITTLEPDYVPCPFSAEYQNYTQCAIEKAQKHLGLSIEYDLRKGIHEYLKELLTVPQS
jgi:ADP-L-glycero-D-manno-heptose 6-epimerase